MLLGLPSIPLCPLHKEFRYALRISAAPKDIRHSKSPMPESAGKENESAGCAEAMSSGSSDYLCFSFPSTEVCGRERGYRWIGKDKCHDR